jgi:hypothetical protein
MFLARLKRRLKHHWKGLLIRGVSYTAIIFVLDMIRGYRWWVALAWGLGMAIGVILLAATTYQIWLAGADET